MNVRESYSCALEQGTLLVEDSEAFGGGHGSLPLREENDREDNELVVYLVWSQYIL